MSTKLNPGKFNCYDKALPDEEMFVLLARDAAAPAAIRAWVDRRIMSGRNEAEDEQIVEALACADRMYAQRPTLHNALGSTKP